MTKPGPSQPAIAAVVLAAGLSQRMELGPKLLLDVAGEPMIRRTVRHVLGVTPTEAIVVTGHEADAVEAALAGLAVRCVRNGAYRDGQASSVACGVRALEKTCDAVLIMPGDQPLVTEAHLAELIGAFARLTERSILVPYHQGRRGTPILVSARHVAEMAGGGLDIGCRKLIERRPEAVAATAFDSDAFTFDCDTREDYERLLARIGAP